MKVSLLNFFVALFLLNSLSCFAWLSLFEDPNNQCIKTSCQEKGAKCGTMKTGLGACNAPYICNDRSGTCTDSLTLGSPCSSDLLCNTGDLTIYDRYCNSSGKCQVLSRKDQPCNNETLCDSSLVCESSVCKSTGVVEGQPCSSSNKCLPGLFCHNGSATCQKYLSAGANCSAILPCDIGHSCLNGTCVQDYTQVAGKPCSKRSCKGPFVCSNTGVCVNVSPPPKNRECVKDADCGSESSECLCDSASGRKTCVAKKPASDTDVNLYRDAIKCVCESGYDERPCYSKTLKWLASCWSDRPIPVPEMYCAITGAGVPLIPPVFFILLFMLLIA